MSAKDVAVTFAPEAQRWIWTTIEAFRPLLSPITRHATMAPPPQRPAPAFPPALETFFLSQAQYAAEPLRIAGCVSRLMNNLSQMHGRLSNAATLFADGAGDGTEAAYNEVPRRQIFITPRYLTCGPRTRVYVLVHEAAHNLSEGIQDFLRTPPTTFEEAMRNAYSYSDCVYRAMFGRSRRNDQE